MTTEIAVMNKQAIALAADSAVSTYNKIFQSANKIFSLSKCAPVAIMIYNKSDFCGVPWESVIKNFRRKIKNKKFSKLSDYSDKFIEYLLSDEIVSKNIHDNKSFFHISILNFSDSILNDINKNVETFSNENGGISDEDIPRIINDRIQFCHDYFHGLAALDIRTDIDEQKFNEWYGEIIDKVVLEKFSRFEGYVENLYSKLKKIIYILSTSVFFAFGYSGIVFAGFGEDEIFPSVINYSIGNYVGGKLQIAINKEKSLAISQHNNASIVPFAQEDIIEMFVAGIHPAVKNNMFRLFESALREQTQGLIELLDVSKKKITETKESVDVLNSAIRRKLQELIPTITNNFINPTIEAVAILPPKELANFAESLVNLTSIKRQVSNDRETVGGPTDVALISKGDGLIWVKRKHYFDPNLNHHFFSNYFSFEGSHEDCKKQEEDDF